MSKTSGGGYAQPSETGPVITSRVTAEPAQHIPYSTATTTSSCTFCGETGITFPHTCKVSDINKIPDLTNRFDPFEALDIIMSFVQTDTQLDKVFADTVRNLVHALRAYIPEMKGYKEPSSKVTKTADFVKGISSTTGEDDFYGK